MLNNHERIVVPPECGFVVWWHETYRDWSRESNHDPDALGQFLQDLSTSKKIETWNLDFAALGEFICYEDPGDYAELVSCVYTFFGKSTRKAFHRWGDKNNFHIEWIELLNDLFPRACFVHIVRDGRDVACSYRNLENLETASKYAPQLPTDVAAIAAQWAGNVRKATSSFATIGWDRVCEVRYEDLVVNSRIELGRICDFLGEPYDDDMLHYYVHNREEVQEPAEFLAWKSKTVEKPTTSEIGKFRRELAKEDVEVFERHAGPVLERYGYQCSSRSDPTPARSTG
jgi:hypothetical protein